MEPVSQSNPCTCQKQPVKVVNQLFFVVEHVEHVALSTAQKVCVHQHALHGDNSAADGEEQAKLPPP